MTPSERPKQAASTDHNLEEVKKLMQFVDRCAQGSQVVDDFESLEKLVESLRPSILGVDRLSLDGNLKKCREIHENKHGIKNRVLKSVDRLVPGAEIAYQKGEEIVQDPKVQEQVRGIYQNTADLVVDLWKKISPS